MKEIKSQRAPGRIPMPPLMRIMEDANHVLRERNMPECKYVEPVADGDSMNPQVIGFTDRPRYVIKVIYPDAVTWHGEHLAANLSVASRAANEIRKRTMLPIPEHYCVSVDRVGLLPMVIMEYMQGEPLVYVLENASEEECVELCSDWGGKLARLHNPDHLDLLDGIAEVEASRTFNNGWALYHLERYADSEWHQDRSSSIINYINERLPLESKYEYPAFSKHGLDVRDFVATKHPVAQVSGMLDWERVEYDDALVSLVCIWIRLHYLGISYATPHFLEAYEQERGAELLQSKRVEFLLMNRLLPPSGHNQSARRIVDMLLAGVKFPFAVRCCS